MTEQQIELGIEDRAPEAGATQCPSSATDFVQILVPVTTANTMAEVAAAVAHHVEGKRVRALPYPKVVFHKRAEAARRDDRR